MKPGLYRLVSDVKNPEADRRVKDDWRQRSQWDADWLFRVTARSADLYDQDEALDLQCTNIEAHLVPRRWTHHSIMLGRVWDGKDVPGGKRGFRLSDDARARALHECLEPMPLDNLEAGLAYYNENLADSPMLLRILVGEGFVTETQALAVMGKLDRDDYEKYWPDEE